LQHDGAVSVVVGDGEVAAGEAHVLGHRQRHRVRRAELRGASASADEVSSSNSIEIDRS
jgi:hypothetical protein